MIPRFRRIRARWRLWWRFKLNNNTVIHSELTPDEKEEMKRKGFWGPELPKYLADNFINAVKNNTLDNVSPERTIDFGDVPQEVIDKIIHEYEVWHELTGGTFFDWMDKRREEELKRIQEEK